jgi:hypothetical protein
MSRKKRSPAKSRPQCKPSPSTAITTSSLAAGVSPAPRAEQPAATAITTQARKPVPVSVVDKPGSQPASLPSPYVRIARALGSLKLAIFSLSFFAVVLAVGTIVESKYSSKVAMELVYRTWWFKLLLAVLAINIFFAAVKKWPWKKHQIGFLITHLGLLTMIAGGLLNSFSGTDSLLVLVDSDESATQSKEGVPQVSNLMMDRDAGLIRVRLPGKDKVAEYDFNPGSLPWQRDPKASGSPTKLLQILDFAAHPLPRTWGVSLDDGTRLDVVAYYPHVRLEQYSEADEGDPGNRFPGVKVRVFSPQGVLPAKWLVPSPHSLMSQVSEVGPSMLEMLGTCPRELLDQFLHPPDANKLGDKGLLVFHWKGKGETVGPISVVKAEASDKPISLGKAGLQVRNLEYKEKGRAGDPHRTGKGPEDPAVSFEVFQGEEKVAACTAFARLAGWLQMEGNPNGNKDLEGLRVWYHPPDYSYHTKGLRGLLQFVRCDDKLYFRSFHTRPGSFEFEDSGPVRADHEPQAVWSGMNFKFQVTDQLKRAVPKNRYVPVNLKPGAEREGYTPAVSARLTGHGESTVVWLRQTGNLLVHPDQLLTPVNLGGKTYEVGYSVQLRELPFEVKLLRAEQTVDPGTQSPATYTSYVQLTDAAKKIKGRDEVITMNEPLNHRGYKVYQSGYEPLGFDGSFRPVNRSTFTVGRDPGMYLKYAGTFMLAGGIACMFYMRAYFFKPRRRAPAVSDSVGRQISTKG